MNAAEFVGKQLAGKKAQYAGDPGHARHDAQVRPRAQRRHRHRLLQPGSLSEYGVKIAPDAYVQLPGDHVAPLAIRPIAQEYAPVAIAKLKSAGVTTIILLADGGMTGR